MKQRISPVMAGLMLGVAILVDGLQFLLTLTVVGSIVAMVLTVFSWTLFFLWFALLGVNYFERGASTRALIAMTSAAAELVPFVNAIPGTTLGVLALIIHTYIEDKKRANLPQNPARTRALVRQAADAARKSQLIQAAQVAREARAQREQ